MKKRVVITGEGSISPLGHNSKSLWKSLVEGKSGIDFISSFDTENFSIKIAGEIKDFEPNNFFEAKEVRKLDRFTIFGLMVDHFWYKQEIYCPSKQVLENFCFQNLQKNPKV